jgi:hypothetical protein
MTKKSKMEVGALVALLLVAAFIWYSFVRSKTQADGFRTAVADYKPMAVENPQIHWDRLAEAQETEYKTSGRDIFSHAMPIPEPLPFRTPQVTEAEATPAPVPPPPPPPPKLPLKFFGYGTVEDASGRRAFLSDAETVYVVAEGDTVLNRYRILRISRANLEFEEIASGRHGSAAIDDQGPQQ